ncbi:MAG: hypothetical protein JWN65_1637 [Solirubrobacterales bacterium]|nr:hypothetical protein [Solirubrobacterales bacterium]
MSFLVRFAPPSMSTAQYEEVKRSVGDSVGFPPKGLELHICFGEEGKRRVTEVWSSMEAFRPFSERLMPAISAAGIEIEDPEMLPVQSMIVSDEPMPADDTGQVVRFRPASLTRAQYDQVSSRLDEQGLFPAKGARLHVLTGEDGTLQVGEVWAGAEEFDAFFARLQPLMEEAGITPTEPERFPLHKLVVTDAARQHTTA